MAILTPPADTKMWSSAGPMPEDSTPSEMRLSHQMQMFRNEMRIAQGDIRGNLRFVNVFHTSILMMNSIAIIAVLVRTFA